MWLFAAVLVLWGSTFELARWEHWVLSPVTLWTWWTSLLYVCGIAATCPVRSLADRVMGLFGYCLVAVYYLIMSTTYMEFLPADPANPDLWPTLFLTVNLLGPLLVITVGLVAGGSPIVQRRG